MSAKTEQPTGNFREALTFDDVLLVPGYSEVIPEDIDTATQSDRGPSGCRFPSCPRPWTR